MRKHTIDTRQQLIMAALSIITWFALVLQFSLSLNTTGTTGFSITKTIINFFSYFTILSNLLVAISLTVLLISPTSKAGSFFSQATSRSAIAVYIFIVGLVYNLVLRNIWVPTGWQLVADNLLHVAVPLLYIIYWYFFTPKKTLYWKNILPWLIFPALYLSYSLLRGNIADWYPYPFIHAGDLGYGKVAVNSLFVLVAIVIVGFAVISINRLGKYKQVTER
jgi:hypothetical protein